MFNMCTKYEVSIFNRSKDIKGVPKFRNWSRDLSHAPLGSNFHNPTKGEWLIIADIQTRHCSLPRHCVNVSIILESTICDKVTIEIGGKKMKLFTGQSNKKLS